MVTEEGFAVISGKVPEDLQSNLRTITQICKERYKTIKGGRHDWIDELETSELKGSIEAIRDQPYIFAAIGEKFPGCDIRPVKEADEIYWSVSPKDANGSDRTLVDCHYDSPFRFIPTGGVVFYRVLVGCNENNEVSTHFPGENVSVKMSTGDYHGLDYSNDYHCVTGSIPSGKYRVVLKLHYLVVPKGSEWCASAVQSMNVNWNRFSRTVMNKSSNPTTWWEHLLAWIINTSRFLFLNIVYVVGILILFFVARRIDLKMLSRGRLRWTSTRPTR